MKHPIEAQRFGDLGAGFLAQWKLSMGPRPGSPGAANHPLSAIHKLKTVAELRGWLRLPMVDPDAAQLRGYAALKAAFAALPADGQLGPAWWDFQARSEALLEAEVAELPFRPTEHISLQLKPEVNGWIYALAVGRGGLAKLSGKPLMLDLPAPVQPRALPVWGHGPQEVVEVVDFAAPAGKAARIRQELGEERLTVRLMVGGERSDAMQWQVAALAEAVAVLHPDQFWAAVDRLRGAARMPPAAIPGRLDGLAIDRERVGALAVGTELRAGLLADMQMLNLCGVPPERPLFLMGTKVFTGAEGLEALRPAPGGGVRMNWIQLLRQPPNDLKVTFTYGSEHAPDSPGGQDNLSLWPDGRLELEVRERGQLRRWRARCAAPVVREFLDTLVECGYPQIPMHPLLPGVSCWGVMAVCGAARTQAIFARSPLEYQAPFDRVFQIGTSLCAQIRQEPAVGLANHLPPSVEGIESL